MKLIILLIFGCLLGYLCYIMFQVSMVFGIVFTVLATCSFITIILSLGIDYNNNSNTKE